ncbi:MAG: hypothetical protein CSA32_00890 [Desulfobulbus propionicus]|nr:MAG: hypothetical protein CSA32_00890 [Desulfobulbus propionicus]
MITTESVTDHGHFIFRGHSFPHTLVCGVSLRLLTCAKEGLCPFFVPLASYTSERENNTEVQTP